MWPINETKVWGSLEMSSMIRAVSESSSFPDTIEPPIYFGQKMAMDTSRLERETPTMSTWCSNQLSYASVDIKIITPREFM